MDGLRPTTQHDLHDDSIVFDINGEEFATHDFRIYRFKVRTPNVRLQRLSTTSSSAGSHLHWILQVEKCPKQRPHDWTQCPFAHPGERACRRDPRHFSYSGAACAEFRRVRYHVMTHHDLCFS